jgi:hypothetical protein
MIQMKMSLNIIKKLVHFTLLAPWVYIDLTIEGQTNKQLRSLRTFMFVNSSWGCT